MERGDRLDEKENKNINIQEQVRIMMQNHKSIGLYMEDSPASPEEISVHCVRESGVYMADYVINDRGILEQIRFNKVE